MAHYKPAKINDKWYFCRHQSAKKMKAGHCITCNGHNTPDEAREHFKQYLIENATHETTSTINNCKVCGKFTYIIFSTFMGIHVPLCSDHDMQDQDGNITGLKEAIKACDYVTSR